MPVRGDEIDRVEREITERLDAGSLTTAEAAARRQELRASFALLRTGVTTGAADKLTIACNRLEQLARFKSIADQRWVVGKLAKVRAMQLVGDSNVATNEQASTSDCDVLIMAALFEPELEQFILRLPEARENVGRGEGFLSGRTYYSGLLKSRHGNCERPIKVIALFQDRMGMVECAAVISNAIAVWRPRLVAMTGVCAGRAEAGVKLNDVIVPSAVFTYDTGKRTAAGFLREPLWADLSSRVIQRVRVRGNAILREMAVEIRAAFPGDLTMPAIHTDVMACGSSVIDLPGVIGKIAGVHRKVVALDMESYALVRATQMSDSRVQAVIVKGVMDLSHEKSDGVKTQAAAWAASFLTRFIESEFEAVCARTESGDFPSLQ